VSRPIETRWLLSGSYASDTANAEARSGTQSALGKI
jgi:hypothetical protein